MSTAPVEMPLSAVVHSVGIGNCIITAEKDVWLAAYGLGSCVALAVWDPVARLAGMIHVLLPEPIKEGDTAVTRYASTGVPHLLREMEAAGGRRGRWRLVAAGGAQMLKALARSGNGAGIGERNVQVVTTTIQCEKLVLAATDFGGVAGRTLSMDTATGQIFVRTTGGALHPL